MDDKADVEFLRNMLIENIDQLYYQERNYYDSKERRYTLGADDFLDSCEVVKKEMLAANKSLWLPAPEGPAQPYHLCDFVTTDTFNIKYKIKETTHGKLFRGLIADDHVVDMKTWEFLFPFQNCYMNHLTTFCRELKILTEDEPHPALVEIKGFCYSCRLAIVYDEKLPETSLEDLCLGKNFEWKDRLKVATQLASVFVWLHKKRISFGSVRTSTIMVDQDFNIKVFDFEFLAHVSEEDDSVPAKYRLFVDAPECEDGIRTLKSDVYTFGVLLLELVAKEKRLSSVREWLWEQFRGDIRPFMEPSLYRNFNLASRFNQIVVGCLEKTPTSRPDMEHVHTALSALEEEYSSSGCVRYEEVPENVFQISDDWFRGGPIRFLAKSEARLYYGAYNI